MSDQLKNRIVGILVLTALAVIFLPNLLNGEKRRLEENFATIPLGPVALPQGVPEEAFEAISAEPTKTQPQVEAKPSAAVPSKKTQSQSARVKTDAAAKPPAKSDVVKSGWTLQVGSFKNAKNVTRLVSELRNKGFRAYSVPTRPIGGKMNRVFVGPDVSKARMEKERQRLAKATSYKGDLLPYKATDI